VLHKEIPFLRICLPLCAGIISGLYVSPGSVFFITGGILILSAFSVSLFFNMREANVVYGWSLTSSLLLCGNLLYTNEKNSISVLNSAQTILVGSVSDYPAEKPGSYLLTLNLKSRITGNGSEPVTGSILLYHKIDSLMPRLMPGDILVIKCSPSEISVRGNPYEFNYRFYMECQGVKYYAQTTTRNILSYSAPVHRKLIYRALILRDRIIRMYNERGITGERLALVAAITLGQKNMLDADQKSYFIKAGVMHIMAVSGLHTVILSLFVFKVLFFLKGRFNIIRILITLIIVWGFAFVTGLTPSVLRATMMFSFLQAGSLLKRPANGINSVLASALVLMLIRPSVIFDAGFLLSYSAVIYIIAFYRDLYQAWTFKYSISDKIWQSAAITIVAQAGTLPLTIALFNRFPVYFILTNVIIVPLSSLLVIIGCIIPLLYPIKFLSHLLAMILSSLTGLTEYLTQTAASLPFATVENIGMTSAGCILLTVVIFLFTCFLKDRRTVPLSYPLAALLLFLLAGTAREVIIRKSNEIIIYNTPGFSTIGIRTGKILNLYSDTAAAGNEVKRHCASLGLKIKMNVVDGRNNYILAGTTRLLITNMLNNKIIDGFSPDIVVLTGAKPEIDFNGAEGQFPEVPVISAAGFPKFLHSPSRKLKSSARVFLVRRSGAYIRRI
jgi:competence protein ComEC